MPPRIKARNINSSDYLMVGGHCWWSFTRLSNPQGKVRIVIDDEIAAVNAPIVRTGPIEGAAFGQNQQAGGAVIEWNKPNPGIIVFEGAPTFRVTAIVIFPADRTD